MTRERGEIGGGGEGGYAAFAQNFRADKKLNAKPGDSRQLRQPRLVWGMRRERRGSSQDHRVPDIPGGLSRWTVVIPLNPGTIPRRVLQRPLAREGKKD